MYIMNNQTKNIQNTSLEQSPGHQSDQLTENAREQSRRGQILSRVLPAALALTLFAGVAHEAREAKRTANLAMEQVGEAQDELEAAQSRIEVLSEISGIDSNLLEARENFRTLPEGSGFISPEVAKRQDEATMYILSYDSTLPEADDMELQFSCTAVKSGDNTLTSAAHCFTSYVNLLTPDGETASLKGGPSYGNEVESYASTRKYFVASRPSMTLAEAREEALAISGMALDHHTSDSAVLAVDAGAARDLQWFDNVEPLQMRSEQPFAGEYARVSGYPDGSEAPVSAEGVVLGQLLPDNVGLHYKKPLTMVAFRAVDNEDLSCSFGASGSTMVDGVGNAYGALAYISRSTTPTDSIDVRLYGERLFDIERKLYAQLVGEDFILCGFAPITDTDLKPFATYAELDASSDYTSR